MIGRRCVSHVGRHWGHMATNAIVRAIDGLSVRQGDTAAGFGMTGEATTAIERDAIAWARLRVRIMAGNAAQFALALLVALARHHLFDLSDKVNRIWIGRLG